MAMHARPVPLDPYNPSRGGGGADDGGVRYPAPLLPIRVPVFAPVLFLNDWIVRVLSVGTAVGGAGAGGQGWGGGPAGRRTRGPLTDGEMREADGGGRGLTGGARVWGQGRGRGASLTSAKTTLSSR